MLREAAPQCKVPQKALENQQESDGQTLKPKACLLRGLAPLLKSSASGPPTAVGLVEVEEPWKNPRMVRSLLRHSAVIVTRPPPELCVGE